MTTTPKNSFLNSLFQFLLPVVAIVFLVAGALLVLKSGQGNLDSAAPNGQQAEHGAEELAVGTVLPDFSVQAFGATEAVPISKLGNKVTLINFWATWCEACVVEMPSIVKLRAAYKSRGFDVVAVNVDEEPEKVLAKSAKRLGIDFPVYVDAGGKLSSLFDVHAIPLTVIIDSQRKILMIENGEVDWNSDEMHSRMEKWL